MSKINSYQDLLEEKALLESSLIIKREVIRKDLMELKQEWKPIIDLASGMTRFTRGKANPFLSMGIDLVGDVLLKKVLLGRSGWIVRLIVPLLVKNYSAHILNADGNSIIRQWLDKFRVGSNGKKIIESE